MKGVHCLLVFETVSLTKQDLQLHLALNRSAALRLAAVSLPLLWQLALAHATIVFGSVTSEPVPPLPNTPIQLTLELVDPTQVPVEDAWVLAEFREEGAPKTTQPVTTRFEESDTRGIYRAEVTLPEAGVWQLLLRDQTFRQEEAQASLTFLVGQENDPDDLSFIFPPTATGPANLTTWLIWLVVVPLIAAGVVTAIVLTRPPNNAETE